MGKYGIASGDSWFDSRIGVTGKRVQADGEMGQGDVKNGTGGPSTGPREAGLTRVGGVRNWFWDFLLLQVWGYLPAEQLHGFQYLVGGHTTTGVDVGNDHGYAQFLLEMLELACDFVGGAEHDPGIEDLFV